jgi:two-component system chemotaxis sensor kinase CheA
MDNRDLLLRLLKTFRLEGEERLNTMSLALVSLEQENDSGQRAEIIEGIFREAHSLKGAARAVNLTKIESVCQALENVLAALKRGNITVSEPLIGLLDRALARLGGMLDPAAEKASDVEGLVVRLNSASSGVLKPTPKRSERMEPSSAATPASSETRRVSESVLDETSPALPAQARAKPESDQDAASPALPAQAKATSGTVRIAVEKLETLSRQVESLLGPKLAAENHVVELRRVTAALAERRKRRAGVQPLLGPLAKLLEKLAASGEDPPNELRALLEYLDAEQVHSKLLEDGANKLLVAAERDHRQLTGLVGALQGSARELHMMPCSLVLELFPRLVRDLAVEQGKDVRLRIEGGEIEVDRRLLDELKDPLIHLIRNALDHGIEKPAVRRERQKPAEATISIEISQRDSNKIEIKVSDDGAGIDTERLRATLVESNVLAPDEARQLDERSLLAYAFHSGISTSRLITDLSGRGLGLSIVSEKVTLLGGSVDVSTSKGAGTTFRMALPLTLATFHGLLVRAGGRLYALPATSVERVARVPALDIKTVEGGETIVHDGETVVLARLADVLGTTAAGASPADERETPRRQVVVLKGTPPQAFEVEEVVGEQEVLVKPLGPQLARLRNVSGATVLGTGEVVPVLNVPDLLLAAISHEVAPAPSQETAATSKRERRILVAEDSITSRSLLKGILEAAGFRVITAVDGVDAFTILKTQRCDLLVSDIDMPRMNGLDLTAKVRADKPLAELPVILVTSLASPEDRERGVEAGANAYIVKSSFDQTNLLDAVRRLIG